LEIGTRYSHRHLGVSLLADPSGMDDQAWLVIALGRRRGAGSLPQMGGHAALAADESAPEYGAGLVFISPSELQAAGLVVRVEDGVG